MLPDGTCLASTMKWVLLIVTVILNQHSAEVISSNAVRWKRQTCGINQLKCNSSSCFDRSHLCDGTKHCDDGTDESEDICSRIPCPTEAFRCDYGACIEKTMLCNGEIECVDGSDEKPQECRSTPSSSCQLPPQPKHGQYKLGGCRPPTCQPVVGQYVRTAFLTYECEPDFTLTGPGILLCDEGWSSEFPTCSRVSCPALVDPTRIIKCTLNDTQVDCNKTMAPGTRALVTCEYFYTHAKEFSRFVAICQSDGKWSRGITPCIPKCGERNPRGLPFVAHGYNASYGEYPWHAGIYKENDKRYVHTCGGTIISVRAVVSAAHCFWDHRNERLLDKKLFKILVGKYFLDFKIQESERFVQVPAVERILIHHEFRGEKRQYSSNIALILLKDTIQMTIAVRPVCVDFNRDFDRLFTPGKTGIVVGWGITEVMKQSDTLRVASMQYIAMEDCEKEVPQSFLPFLTRDVFCAGNRNGTSVCPGDSGGGLATQFRDGLWYLVGIVSVGVPSTDANFCNINHFSGFIRVSEYYDFLENNI